MDTVYGHASVDYTYFGSSVNSQGVYVCSVWAAVGEKVKMNLALVFTGEMIWFVLVLNNTCPRSQVL